MDGYTAIKGNWIRCWGVRRSKVLYNEDGKMAVGLYRQCPETQVLFRSSKTHPVRFLHWPKPLLDNIAISNEMKVLKASNQLWGANKNAKTSNKYWRSAWICSRRKWAVLELPNPSEWPSLGEELQAKGKESFGYSKGQNTKRAAFTEFKNPTAAALCSIRSHERKGKFIEANHQIRYQKTDIGARLRIRLLEWYTNRKMP